jgi:hypothetical protein
MTYCHVLLSFTQQIKIFLFYWQRITSTLENKVRAEKLKIFSLMTTILKSMREKTLSHFKPQ